MKELGREHVDALSEVLQAASLMLKHLPGKNTGNMFECAEVRRGFEWLNRAVSQFYRARSVVYFVQVGDKIKIGFTGDIKKRVTDLSVLASKPVRLLGTMPGGKDDEQWLHREFGRLKTHGEWFIAAEALIQYARSANQAHDEATGPPPPIPCPNGPF